MSGIRLEHKIDVSEAQRALANLYGLDQRQLADEIGHYVLSETLHNFDQAQTPEGEQWKKSKRAESDGGKTLQHHGHLRDSYNYIVGLGGDFVEIGSNMIYAAIHHFGGETGRKSARFEMDARPALGLTDEMESEIGDMTLAFYGKPLGGL
jgi:phage virion morphogenesis protein